MAFGNKSRCGSNYTTRCIFFCSNPEACPYDETSRIFFLALGGWIGLATAQRADTLQLQTVSVQAQRPSYVTGYSDWKADTLLIRLMPSATVSDWLEQQGGLTLRTYGLGGLSTPAGRGSGSAQTAVLWDGFQLTSPMNGISDLALLPLFLVDDNRV